MASRRSTVRVASRGPGSIYSRECGLVDRHRSVVGLTADRPLKNGRVDEGGFGMRVARRVTARATFDEYTLDALAEDVRQLVLVDEVTLAFFSFGASAKTRWRQAANRGCVSWNPILRLALR